jgi:hypothetical protein
MRRRLLFLALACGLVAASLVHPVRAAGCDECLESCNSIPMATDECLEMYCPECASASLPTGSGIGT